WSADFHGLPWSSVAWKRGAGSPTFRSAGLSSFADRAPAARTQAPAASAARAIRCNARMVLLLVLGDTVGNRLAAKAGGGPMVGRNTDDGRGRGRGVKRKSRPGVDPAAVGADNRAGGSHGSAGPGTVPGADDRGGSVVAVLLHGQLAG